MYLDEENTNPVVGGDEATDAPVTEEAAPEAAEGDVATEEAAPEAAEGGEETPAK